MKNGYTIIDAHAHIFPDKIAERASDEISKFYDLPMKYHGSVSEMLESGLAAGIDAFLVCSAATSPVQVHSINMFVASCASAYPMCIPFGTLHPRSDYSETEFEEIRQLHLRGVKLHPDFQNFAIDDPSVFPIYDMIQQSGLPLLLHMGDARTDLSHPARLAKVLQEFPKLHVVAAHLGGWGRWAEAREYLSPDERLRFDTSSSLPLLSVEAARKQILHFGVENCFFGVDYPMWDYTEEIDRLLALGFTEEENKRLFASNFITWMHEMPRF